MDSEMLARSLDSSLKKTDVIGACAAVIRNRPGGQPVLWQTAAGFSDAGRTQPLAPDALFLTYSIVKTLIAVLVLRICEERKVALDSAVGDFLPELQALPKITIRQLLNHSSGLPDYGGLASYKTAVRDGVTPWSGEQFFERTMQSGAVFKPGEGFHYSNLGYLQLRRLLEIVTGKSFENLVTTLLEDCDLRQTALCADMGDMEKLTPGLSRWFDPAIVQDARAVYDPRWVATGVLSSTAADTAKFMNSVFVGSVFTAGQRREMLDFIKVDMDHHLFRTPSYGLGLMIDPDSPEGFLAGHTGGGPGYQSACYHIVSEPVSITIAVLANSDAPHVVEALMFELFSLFPLE